MSRSFDPYREWLALDTAPATYYELLGVPHGEHDPQTIAAARARVLEKLAQVPKDQRTDAWEAIVRQVRQAARTLLDAQQRSDYDASLARAAPLATVRSTNHGKSAPLALPISSPIATSTTSTAPMPTIRPVSKRRRSVLPHLLFSTALLIAVGVAGVQLIEVLRLQGWHAPQEQSPHTAPPVAAVVEPGNNLHQPSNKSPHARSNSVRSPQSSAGFSDGAPNRPSAPSQAFVADVFALLAARKIGAAAQQIDDLAEEHSAMATSLRALSLSVAIYWQGIEQGLQQLSTGQMITYEGQAAIVVSRTDDELVVRTAGRNETIALNPLPTWLVTQLEQRWFDMTQPENWIAVGAWEFIRSDGDLNRAEALWRRAAAAGQPIEPLLPLLTLDRPQQ